MGVAQGIGIMMGLATINPGNDLIRLIEQERVCTDQSVDNLERLVGQLVDDIQSSADVPARCKALSARLFAPEAVVIWLGKSPQPWRADSDRAAGNMT